MKRQPVNSSLISSIGIEEGPEGPVMEIEFAGDSGKPGRIYQYTGPKVREHHDNLMKAESVGKHFLRVVKKCPDTKFKQVGAAQS